MNRIEFLQSIDHQDKDQVTELISFFDQFMALFSLVGSYSNMEVFNNESNDSFIRFTISFDNAEKVNLLQQAIISANNCITIYCKTFFIDYSILSIKSMSIIFKI
jgi:hypothetical protein